MFSSVIVFILGNLKYWISIPISIILTIALIKAILNSPKMKTSLFSSKPKLICVLAIIILWIICSGIGGFIWQNRWDHKFRNAVFRDLVFNKWPVVQGDKALCYYLGFWMIPAVFGKMFGLVAGYAFQTFWAIIGTILTFGMICQFVKKVSVKNLIILILFSGLDVILFFMFSKLSFSETLLQVLKGEHLENLTIYFQGSSITTTVFWVYNQTIPFWVGMMLLLLQKNVKSIVYIYSLMFLYSPFPVVGIAPLMVYFVFRKQENIEEKNILKNMLLKIKNVITFENVASLFIFIIVALFFKSNIAAGKVELLKPDIKILFLFGMYFLSEYIIYILLLYRYNKKDKILGILLITVFFYSFIKVGGGKDFSMRTNIPLIFYMSLVVMKQLQRKDVSKVINALLIAVLCIGAVTPATEFIRTFSHELIQVRIKGTEFSRNEELDTVFDKEKNECYKNFIADRDSIFFKYLAKQNEDKDE